jgi:hypothetical protein
MPKTIDEQAEEILAIISDPVKLRAKAATLPDTPLTAAFGNCRSLDEKIILMASAYGADAAAAVLRLGRVDAISMREAAKVLERAGQVKLADMAKEVAKTAPREAAWKVANRRHRRAQKAAHLAARKAPNAR